MERPARPGQLERDGQSLPLAFELLAEIATGPTARVELCRIRSPKELAGKLVAVKRLHPHIAEDPQFYSMFVDEVWMTAALDHPNVTRVAGWGTDSEGTYLAVELVEGVSLARLMKTVFETREAFTERMVVYLGSELCAGLSAAHGLRSAEGELLQLVHRDLTPGNILLGFDGRVLIADFGLAKAKQRVTKTLTGLLKGHPHYMAPEQASEEPIDGRADLFSLGVVLFELFTGRHPWSGGNELEVFQLMANEPPEDLAALRPKLDPELVNVVNRLLAKDPDDRFAHAGEARDRLLYWLDAHGYKDDNLDAVARFVRRNAMRQMRWFERAVAGDFVAEATRAKSRLLGARARSMPRPPANGTSLTSRSSTTASPGPRRRAARRIAEDQTDVSDIGARIDPPPSGETPDWGEEVPTVVQPNRQLPLHRSKNIPPPTNSPTTTQYTRPPLEPVPLISMPEDSDVEGLPSFADEDSSENRKTGVKPQVSLAVLAKAKYGRMETMRDLPTVNDPQSEDVPTSPLRRKPRLPDPPLRKLPPPRADTPVPPPPQVAPEPTGEQQRPTSGRRGTRRLPRTEADFLAEAEQLGQTAARLRTEADQAAKVAAHRAVLAQLASEAAQLAAEAARTSTTHGLSHALTLIEEAHRLQASIDRGEAQTSSLEKPPEPAPQAPDGAAIVSSVPAAAPTPIMPPTADNFPAPVPGERPSYAPPPMIDPRREPTGPSVRLITNPPPPSHQQPPPPASSMLAGEVFGVRVPVALAAAFIIAIAMVVLVWLIVS